jgi:hypothetical protein
MQDEKDNKQTMRDVLEAMRQSLETQRMCLEMTIEQNNLNAKVMFARYESLREAGFSEYQAFEIVKFRGSQM